MTEKKTEGKKPAEKKTTTVKPKTDVDKLSLARKIAKATAEMEPVGKNGINTSQGWRFQTESDIKAAVRKVLGANHFAIIPTEVKILKKDVQQISRTFKGRHYQQTLTSYDILESFTITDGQSALPGQMVGSGSDYGDKALSKATTMALKNFEKHLFNIADKEDDPDAQTVGTSQNAQNRPVRQNKPARNNHTKLSQKDMQLLINKAKIYKVSYKGKDILLTKVMAAEKDHNQEAKKFLDDWRKVKKTHNNLYEFIQKEKLV